MGAKSAASNPYMGLRGGTGKFASPTWPATSAVSSTS